MKTLLYLVMVFSFLIVISVLGQASRPQVSLTDEVLWNNLFKFISNFAFFSAMAFMAFTIVASLFYLEVGNYLGQSKLNNFLFGKYHRPIVEDRIFMFLDMKASTTIAEELGHVKYFNLLKEYFSTISPLTIEFNAEIYQYVGDEIVLSWQKEKGLEDSNCIRCFFAMREALDERAIYFQNKFGQRPSFKAGIHMGEVTAGEIGEEKKEIVYTGDALNTTARIQSLCNEYNVDLLLSGHMIDSLGISENKNVVNLGSASLRGREELVQLYLIDGLSKLKK